MTDTVKIGDAVVHEVLNPDEFQQLIRSVGKTMGSGCLGDAQVKVKTQLEPWVVELCGAIQMHGEPHFWTIDVDMRAVKTADDVISICGQLEGSFDKAAGQLGRPA